MEFGSIPLLTLDKMGPIWGLFKNPHSNNYVLSINYISNVMDAAPPSKLLIYKDNIHYHPNHGTVAAPLNLNVHSNYVLVDILIVLNYLGSSDHRF